MPSGGAGRGARGGPKGKRDHGHELHHVLRGRRLRVERLHVDQAMVRARPGGRSGRSPRSGPVPASVHRESPAQVPPPAGAARAMSTRRAAPGPASSLSTAHVGLGGGAVGQHAPQRLQAAVQQQPLFGEGAGGRRRRAEARRAQEHGGMLRPPRRQAELGEHERPDVRPLLERASRRGLPWPWPARVSSRSRTGRPDDVAACRRAAILRACSGSTRLSDSPVVSSTAG